MIFETNLQSEVAIPEGWSVQNLTDFVLLNPENISSKELKNSSEQVIRYVDISSVGHRTWENPAEIKLGDSPSRARRQIRFGDTIISTVRPNRKSLLFVSKELDGSIASTGFLVCRPKLAEDTNWVHYLLTSQQASEYYEQHADGAAYPAFNPTLLERTSCLVPPKEERVRFGSFMATLDSYINNLSQQNIVLESIAQTLFKSWFVNFDPVHAKAAGLEPAGMSTEIAALFPSEFEESELGLIPKGWQIKSVESCVDRLRPSSVFSQADCQPNLGTSLFDQSANIFVGYMDGEGKVDSSEHNPAFIFGDHTCVMRLHTEPFNIAANVIPLKAKDSKSYWLYYAMQGLQQFESYRRHWSELKVKKIVHANSSIKERFELLARTFHKAIENNEKTCFVLSQIRDELLPRLISGKIRIEEAEEALESVLPPQEKKVA